MKEKTFNRVFCGFLSVTCAAGIFGIVHGCANAANKAEKPSETVYIVYTDEQSHPYAVLTDPRIMEPAEPAFTLTQTERETVARIVAGQAGGKPVTCQTMVANVLYNQIHANGDKIDGTDYAKCGRQTPSAETYKAVDAIFTRGEWLLDDTVLWTGDAEHPDEWHRTLRTVTVNDGIAFYEVK